MTPQRKLFEAWLKKADHDLIVAGLCAGNKPPLFDEAAYHCQQAAEKSIKAFLTLSDIEFPKIHDITKLLQLAIPKNNLYGNFLDDADRLTKYSTVTRYPEDQEEISSSEFEKAFHVAKALYKVTQGI